MTFEFAFFIALALFIAGGLSYFALAPMLAGYKPFTSPKQAAREPDKRRLRGGKNG